VSPLAAGFSCARPAFQSRHQIDYERRSDDFPSLDGDTFDLGLDQLPQRLLIAVSEFARVETAGPLVDDRTLGDAASRQDIMRAQRSPTRGT